MAGERRFKIAGCLVAGVVAVGIAAAILYRNLMWELDPPERGIAGEIVFSTPIDVDCIKRALEGEFGDVHNFVFWGETMDDTFNYYDSPDGNAWVLLAVTELSQGMRVSHSFIGHGHRLPQSEFPPAIAAAPSFSISMARCRTRRSG